MPEFPIILPVVQPLTLEQAEQLHAALGAAIEATREKQRADALAAREHMIASDIAALPNIAVDHLTIELSIAEELVAKNPDSPLYASYANAAREEVARRQAATADSKASAR
ncbi:hypothetical protein AB0B89_29280 [Sphaerisporangium sp. NPDC049002]|uniref:hypothetical protein n=1 Tax=Sphaerisporangium sp. NPDC049002 TaxID=3155392 RepID=UPI00340FD910